MTEVTPRWEPPATQPRDEVRADGLRIFAQVVGRPVQPEQSTGRNWSRNPSDGAPGRQDTDRRPENLLVAVSTPESRAPAQHHGRSRSDGRASELPVGVTCTDAVRGSGAAGSVGTGEATRRDGAVT